VTLPSENFSIKSIEVYSITGHKVLEIKSTRFDASNLSSGIYIVKVATTDGKSKSQKLIKK
jgi:hypothetical protein